MNSELVINKSRNNISDAPVTTARYTIVVVMNEDNPDGTDEEHRNAFAKELQRAMDNGYFEYIRYDAIEFKVTKREVLDVAPAGKP